MKKSINSIERFLTKFQTTRRRLPYKPMVRGFRIGIGKVEHHILKVVGDVLGTAREGFHMSSRFSLGALVGVLVALLAVPVVKGQDLGRQVLATDYLQEPTPAVSGNASDPSLIQMSEVLSRLEATELELSRLRSQMLSAQDGGFPLSTMQGSGDSGGAGSEVDNGTDPSNFQRRVFFYNDYFRIQGVGNVNITYTFMAFPILKDDTGRAKGIFNFEIPVVYGDLDNPVPVEAAGLGDVRFRFFLSPKVYKDVLTCGDTLKPLIGTEFYIPSADKTLVDIPDNNVFLQRSLGTGKFRFAPAVGFVYSPKPNIIFAPIYLHNFSVGGISTEPNVNQGWWRIFLMYAFPTGTYLLPELQIITDYEEGGRTDLFFRPEFGQALSKDGTTVYVKPGTQFNHLNFNRDWGIEVGLRLTF
jgi:hypothetical protein